jgi:hypothetical protein
MLGAICQLSWCVNKLTVSSRCFGFVFLSILPSPSASILFQMIKLPMFKTSGKSHLMALIHGYLVAVFIIDDGPCPMKFFCPWLLITCECIPLFLLLPNLIPFICTSQHFSILNLVSPSAAVHHIVRLIIYMSLFRSCTEQAQQTSFCSIGSQGTCCREFSDGVV